MIFANAEASKGWWQEEKRKTREKGIKLVPGRNEVGAILSLKIRQEMPKIMI
jgi:hypothetical protein